ncbi:hypothetical protein DYB31_013678 [Aphanomyces astaci]|uniref:Aldehyde oxidase/xanthine dehydrogenase second molybdopterin binding domain-containing protein n=1 Tax=Aphanomyces astaci TaxID=112090 RepID=A0A397EXJ0_APHAT|nr:hypothetical protein DYB31_013678 [Aphanomyces astaci]
MKLIDLGTTAIDHHKTPYGQELTNVTLDRIWQGLHASADVARRKEAAVYFNSQNKWKKRGLAVTPVKYGIAISGLKYGASVSIFHGDGTVLVTHGKHILGIDTKAAQMAAFMLGIPLAKIKLQPTSTGLIPNSDATGGSSTSESIARSVQYVLPCIRTPCLKNFSFEELTRLDRAACQTLITRLSSVLTTTYPAKSTMCNLDRRITSLPPPRRDSNDTVKMQCERDDAKFIDVSLTARFVSPCTM